MPDGAGSGTDRQTYAALLRGINLGSRNKVSMTDLRALFAALGAEDVATYVQSGNVVFKSRGDRSGLRREIEQRISRELGLEIVVLLRTEAELAGIVAGNPFPQVAEPRQLHVTFLAGAPDRARIGDVGQTGTEPDEFRAVRSEIYLHCPNGYGRSKLSNAYFERLLGVAATTRNWRTVTALAELTRS